MSKTETYLAIIGILVVIVVGLFVAVFPFNDYSDASRIVLSEGIVGIGVGVIIVMVIIIYRGPHSLGNRLQSQS